MRSSKYSGDPRQITAKFKSNCHTCGLPIEKGTTIIYWPNGNKAGHLACDQADYLNSLASFADEDRMNSYFPSPFSLGIGDD